MDQSKLTTIPPQQFFAWWAENLGFEYCHKTQFIRACEFHHNGGNMRNTAVNVYNTKCWESEFFKNQLQNHGK